MTDTSATIVIEYSLKKMLGLVGIGILMTACSTVVVFWSPSLTFTKVVGGYFGIVFFGLCTGIVVWRLVNFRNAPIRISPEGIIDTRVATALIPWSAITKISTWELRGQKCVVLAVKPDVEARLGLTLLSRCTRGPSRLLGADGLGISATGLAIDYNTLLRTCQAYLRQSDRRP